MFYYVNPSLGSLVLLWQEQAYKDYAPTEKGISTFENLLEKIDSNTNSSDWTDVFLIGREAMSYFLINSSVTQYKVGPGFAILSLALALSILFKQSSKPAMKLLYLIPLCILLSPASGNFSLQSFNLIPI